LSLPRKRWEIAAPVPEQARGELDLGEGRLKSLPHDLGEDGFSGLPRLTVQLLHNRGIHGPAAARDFLEGWVSGHSPFRLKGMDAAVGRLRQAIRRGERIAVYGDFDADGVTATVLLVEVLAALGGQVEPYIPHRVDEGYGLNLGALRRLYANGFRVVVTVDCGIRSVAEASAVRGYLDLIITDHHQPGVELPAAVAVVSPKQADCPYPFDGLSGVGLAYKLAQALLRVQARMGQSAAVAEESLLDLVALGTVADLAPLLGENRALVRAGLKVLNEPTRPGIEALLANAAVGPGVVDATAIGFRIGPRLNAAGRLESAMLAYQLLTSREPTEAKSLAETLGALNRRRQELTEQTVAAAEAQVLADHPDARLYMASGRDFNPGIVGLAASRLTEAYYRPCIVVELGDKECRGSCRSIPEFNITEALDRCASLLTRHGGHAAAAGFTVSAQNLTPLRDRLQAIAAEQLAGAELRPALRIDAEIPLEEVDWATLELVEQMEPCGVDNPRPVLLSRGVEVRGVRAMGGEQQHLRLLLRDGRGAARDGVLFRAGELRDRVPGRIDVAYTLEANEWNGQRRLQLNVQDLRPTSG